MVEENIKQNLSSVEYAIKYPFTNKKSKYGSFSQGIISILLFPLIIPLLVFMGYTNNMLENSISENKESPKFNEYHKLLHIGIEKMISYSPLIVLSLFIFFASLILGPFFFGFIPAVLLFTPAITILYSEKRDYQEVYTSDLIELVFTEKYVRLLLYYITFNTLFAAILIWLISISLGFGAIIFAPLFFYSRMAFLGYLYSTKYDELKIE